jgi:hypothetical protein
VARKTKRRQPPRARRPTPPAGAGAGAASATPARASGELRIGGDKALVRSVEMSLNPGSTSRRGGRIVLENTDPAIPLDRVPYFVTDLVQLGIVAAAMVVLLLAGALFVIPHVIH